MKPLFLAILMLLVPTSGYAQGGISRRYPVPTVTLTANPTTLVKGNSSTLAWTSQNATTLGLSGVAPGLQRVSLQGSMRVAPQTTTTYTLQAFGWGGTKTASVKVTVTNPTPPPPAGALQLTSWDGWYWDFNIRNMWSVKEAMAGLPTFDFPQSSNNAFLGYLVATQPKAVSISGTLTMLIDVTVTGNPVFNWQSESVNTCFERPAAVRPFFQGTHNTDTTGRWWATPPNDYVLAPGSMMITVPLTPSYWSDVVGQNGALNSDTLAGFADSLKGVSEIGMTFGGGCFYGHGVNVSGGTAHFQVVNYQIIP